MSRFERSGAPRVVFCAACSRGMTRAEAGAMCSLSESAAFGRAGSSRRAQPDWGMIGPMVDSTGGEMRRTATVTVLFCDPVGSSARTARIGNEAADEFRGVFFAVLGEAVAATHGEVVKNTGDGLMVVFPHSAVDAVTCAGQMHSDVETLDIDDRAYVRVGVSAGEAALERGDWFGTPVVEAARVCAAADRGQPRVSDIVRRLVGSRGGHLFRSVAALLGKGLPEPVPAAMVVRAPIAAPAKVARTRHRYARLVAIVAAALAVPLLAGVLVATVAGGHSKVSAGVPPAKGYTPRFEQKPCAPDFLAKVPNGACGDLVVPEDRSKPHARWIRLWVTRAPALSGRGAADPVIAIGAELGQPDLEDPAKSPARDHAELIAILTRVSEVSDPAMTCPEFEPIGFELLRRPQRDLATIAQGQAALRACHERLARAGVTLSRYTLDDAADDVLDLMRALHLRRATVAAMGDDAISAYAIVRDAPGAVRTLTLDGPDAPGTSVFSDPTGQFAAAVDEYVALCQTDTKCARAYPNLDAMLRTSWQQRSATPLLVDVADPDGSHPRLLFDGDRGAKALASVLGDPRNDPLIAAGIANPPMDISATLAADYDYYFHRPHYPWARSLSSWCSYDQYTIADGSTVSSRTRPELAGVDDGSLQWECAAWPVPKISASAFAGVATDIPTLIVQGALNPSTSPQWASTLQAGLKNAALLSFPTLGARLLLWGLPPCLNDLRRQFLADPSKHLDTNTCTRQSPPINFATSTP